MLICRAGDLPENPKIHSFLKKICIQKRAPEELILQNLYDPETVKVLSEEEIIKVKCFKIKCNNKSTSII